MYLLSNSADLASMDIEDGGAALEYNPIEAQGKNDC